jgi:hypothetical protein
MYPSNVFLALQISNEIAALDLLHGEAIHEELLTFKDTGAHSNSFDAFGISQMNYVLNSGSLLLIFFYIIG